MSPILTISDILKSIPSQSDTAKMQLPNFLLVLLPLVSAVDFNCHPAFEQSLQGTSCPIERVSVAGDVNRASCGTAGVIDFSPGSGNKNGRIKIQNLGSRPADYYYMYAKDGER